MLMQNRIPYKISGGTSFFSRPEIKDLLAYLRVLTNPDDDSAFMRIVNTPKREIGSATLKKLGEWAMGRNKSMFTASFDMGLTQTLNGRGYESLTRFTHWLREIQQLSEREPIAAVRDLIRGVDYESWLYETSPSPKAAEMRMKNVNTLFTWMTEMLEGSDIDEPMTLTQVVTRFTLRDMMERGESDEETDQVQLMTLHASKGLEFPYVYLVGMEEGLLPHQSSIDEDNVDEERRLAYVGITRAQKELTFTLCKERRQYGELVRPEPSRFLLELPPLHCPAALPAANPFHRPARRSYRHSGCLLRQSCRGPSRGRPEYAAVLRQVQPPMRHPYQTDRSPEYASRWRAVRRHQGSRYPNRINARTAR